MNLWLVARGRQLALIALLVIVLTGLISLHGMGFFSSNKRELKQLLGDAGGALIDEAEVVAWQPDPNYKPRAYYVLRPMDEKLFRQLATKLNMTAAPTSALDEAIWKLPPDLHLPDWGAQEVTPGSGLESRGSLDSFNIWMRWHGGKMFLVVLRGS